MDFLLFLFKEKKPTRVSNSSLDLVLPYISSVSFFSLVCYSMRQISLVSVFN